MRASNYRCCSFTSSASCSTAPLPIKRAHAWSFLRSARRCLSRLAFVLAFKRFIQDTVCVYLLDCKPIIRGCVLVLIRGRLGGGLDQTLSLQDYSSKAAATIAAAANAGAAAVGASSVHLNHAAASSSLDYELIGGVSGHVSTLVLLPLPWPGKQLSRA